ncbi:hypothetical protein E2C01_042915 [Portunus trituberculatus]|uniref:Uncharacterized protein n=1 Tax=Portunus trituberculatus TaxID=210409 RepID=A0A5B7FNT9_PORTR|nr:hypothetical protein [Portunus trituberculatus]
MMGWTRCRAGIPGVMCTGAPRLRDGHNDAGGPGTRYVSPAEAKIVELQQGIARDFQVAEDLVDNAIIPGCCCFAPGESTA